MYCSREHQKKDWPRHKLQYVPPSRPSRIPAADDVLLPTAADSTKRSGASSSRRPSPSPTTSCSAKGSPSFANSNGRACQLSSPA